MTWIAFACAIGKNAFSLETRFKAKFIIATSLVLASACAPATSEKADNTGTAVLPQESKGQWVEIPKAPDGKVGSIDLRSIEELGLGARTFVLRYSGGSNMDNAAYKLTKQRVDCPAHTHTMLGSTSYSDKGKVLARWTAGL